MVPLLIIISHYIPLKNHVPVTTNQVSQYYTPISDDFPILGGHLDEPSLWMMQFLWENHHLR